MVLAAPFFRNLDRGFRSRHHSGQRGATRGCKWPEIENVSLDPYGEKLTRGLLTSFMPN